MKHPTMNAIIYYVIAPDHAKEPILTTEKRLIVLKEDLVNFKNVIPSMEDKILDNDIKFTTSGQRIACTTQEAAGLFKA